MNWLHFFLLIAGIYGLYYLAMILYDASFSGKQGPMALSHELIFSETHLPQQVAHLPEKPPEQKPKPEPATTATGGVSLKNLFGLAREEAIIYTRPVSF
ncbi:MAG TPA: hypothetical protein VFE53_24000 [Mucilaginibacter sp.]|jgi:hypothetical protein|nr:hypothetical protein [Mucilaginibacter sp.]